MPKTKVASQITRKLLLYQGHALGGFLPSRTRQDRVGRLRHGAQRRRAEDGAIANPALREQFWRDVKVPAGEELNQSLEKAGRVADFFELAN
jgi:hypothetical protein